MSSEHSNMGHIFNAPFGENLTVCASFNHHAMSTSTQSSSRFPRFARSSHILYRRNKHHFLSKEHGFSYEWEIGMILYYIRKVHITGSRESIFDMFEYLMSVPAFVASNREIRDVVIAKISELDFPGDKEWLHLRMSILGFIDDLIYHSCYTP